MHHRARSENEGRRANAHDEWRETARAFVDARSSRVVVWRDFFHEKRRGDDVSKEGRLCASLFASIRRRDAR